MMVVVHEVGDDGFGIVFHALDVEGDLSSDLMFGGSVVGFDVVVVFGTAMAGGDDDSAMCFFLKIIEEGDENGVDVFLVVD